MYLTINIYLFQKYSIFKSHETDINPEIFRMKYAEMSRDISFFTKKKTHKKKDLYCIIDVKTDFRSKFAVLRLRQSYGRLMLYTPGART